MALDAAYPSPDTLLATVTQWESFNLGLGGSTGVVQGVGSAFSPSLNSGTRSAVLASGAALVRGFYAAKGSSESTSIPVASASNRIDRLVLRLDRSQSGGTTWVKPVVITGTPSGSPSIPAIQSSTSPTGQWDLPIARWTSASNGALSGLVDERYFMAGDLLTFTSAAQPPATTLRLGIETDTRRIMWADGTAWSALSDDSGWVAFSAIGNWAAGSFDLRVRKINNIVQVRGTVERTVNTLQSNSTDSGMATLPSGYRPSSSHFYHPWVYPGSGLVQIDPSDGQIHMLTHTDDIPVGRAVYLHTTFMVG